MGNDPNPDMDFDVYDVGTFCHRHRISRAHFFSLCARGLGPRTMKLRRSLRIRRESAAAWRKQMEKKQ